MRYVLDMKAGRPAYLQIYELLRQDIVSGVYPHGAKLPSKRSLAADLGVSLSTVEHALELLVEEGYAGTRERSGCFAIYRAADQKRICTCGKPIDPRVRSFPQHALPESINSAASAMPSFMLSALPPIFCAVRLWRQDHSRYQDRGT